MKLDRETIIKNRFWILAGTAAGLALIGWLLLLVTVPSTIADERTRIEKPWLKNKRKTGFISSAAVKAMQAEAQALASEKTKMQAELYKTQATQSFLMTWPKAMVDLGFDFKNGKFAQDVEVLKRDPKLLSSRPPDTETRISGTLTGETDADWFTVKDRQGKTHRFMRADKTKVTFADEPTVKDPTINFGKLGSKAQYPVTINFTVGKFFGENFTDSEKRAYQNSYREQFPEVLAELGAANYLNEPEMLQRYLLTRNTKNAGVVITEVANDAWIYKPGRIPPDDNRFFTYVEKWADLLNQISAEEIWTAQEMLWVQRDMYKQLRMANESLALLEPVKGDKADKDGWAKFRNFYWEMDLKEKGGSVEVKLRNMRPQQQAVNKLRFLLRFKDPSNKDGKPSGPVVFPPIEPKELRFDGNPVAPYEKDGNGSDTFQGNIAFTLPAPLKELHSVEQILTVATAAVKRLDSLTLAMSTLTGDSALSHREATKAAALLTYRPKPAKAAPPTALDDEKNKDKIKDTPFGIPVQPQDQQPDLGLDLADPGTEARLDPSVKLSVNKLLLDRYMQKTPELRKLPVSLVMVVGPEHINRVLASLASSPLRFLTTQVLWQRCQLAYGGTPKSAPGTPAPARPATSTQGEIQENVELTVYGVVTIYEPPNRPPLPKQ
jgi:hypothetical protein